jgi:hypothetical protein
MCSYVYPSLANAVGKDVKREQRRSTTWAVLPYVGRFFIFLHQARDVNPAKIRFRDHEVPMRGRKSSAPKNDRASWHEKVYLNPVILPRKWIDYQIRDRFIPSVPFDNVLPLEMDIPLANRAGQPCRVKIRSMDKLYRNVVFSLCNQEGKPVFRQDFRSIPLHSDTVVTFTVSKPGFYAPHIAVEDQVFRREAIIFYRDRTILDDEHRDGEKYEKMLHLLVKGERGTRLFCSRCQAPCVPVEPFFSEGYEHKNYIPIKEYLDIEHLGMERISDFIMRMDHPTSFKRGLIHLLNMLRLAHVEDEVAIVTNLFKDDPPFAYYISDRLFLFGMIPIIEDRELQIILNRLEDRLIAGALVHQGPELVSKVMGNISRRRAAGIRQELQHLPLRYDGSAARQEIHRFIRSHFEQRFGRELRIPIRTKLMYRESGLYDYFEREKPEHLFYHSGGFFLFSGGDLYETVLQVSSVPSIHDSEETCVPFDSETYLADIFTVYGMTETTVFLSSNDGIRYGVIHSYSWNDSLEDMERIENVGKKTVVPIGISAPAVILTIGVITARGVPCEQVIRLKKKGT